MKVRIVKGAAAALVSLACLVSAPASAQTCERGQLYDLFVGTATELEQKLNLLQPDLPFGVHGFRREGQGFQVWVTARCRRRNPHVYKVKYEEYSKEAMTLRMRVAVASPLSVHADRGSNAACVWYAFDQTVAENPELEMPMRAPEPEALAAEDARCANPR